MQTNSHLSRLIHDQAKKYGDREELIYKDFGGSEWKSMSWNQFSDIVMKVSNALLNLGVQVQENVGVFSQNSVQYLESRISMIRLVASLQLAAHLSESSFSIRMSVCLFTTPMPCISMIS